MGHRHAAFCGGDDLDGMKAKHRDVAVPAVAHGFLLVAGADGVRGIFNNFETILNRQRMNGRHVARLTAHVHGHHHFGQFAQLLRLHQFVL